MSYLAAHIEHRARRTARQPAGTDMLPERDQQTINLYPIGTRKNFFKRHRGLFRGWGVDIPPAIRDAVNMDIDGDPRLIAGNAEHEVSALRADPVK
jgi:hypothetical protein